MRLLVSTLTVAALISCGPKAPPEPAAQAAPVPAAEQQPAWSKELAEEKVDAAVSLLLSGTPESASKALALLDEVVAKEPDMVVAIYNQGIAHQQLGELTKAERRFLRATDLDPAYAPAWQNLGALAERTGDLQRALAHYRSGLRDAPDAGELLVGEIRVLRKLGRLDEAIQQARSAIRTNGDNIGAYNNLGLIYLSQG